MFGTDSTNPPEPVQLSFSFVRLSHREIYRRLNAQTGEPETMWFLEPCHPYADEVAEKQVLEVYSTPGKTPFYWTPKKAA